MATPRMALMLLSVLLAPTASLAADVSAGQAVFNRCKICHTFVAGGRTIVGPKLHGLFGRKAGSLEGFSYSEAMKNSGIVWDDETLRKYLTSPRETVPGGKMAFPGIKDSTELDNLLAYLHEATK